MKSVNKICVCIVLLMTQFSSNLLAEPRARAQEPVLVIGGSYASGKVPFNEGMDSPLFGVSANFGSYTSLSDGLIRRGYYVVNEGQGGATTFQRLGCDPVCGTGYWDSYETQLQRALARVALPGGGFNAQYVIITLSNDCLHSAAFGVPQSMALPCTLAEVEQAIQRLVDVGATVLSLGLTPIYLRYPSYSRMDLPLTQQLFGFQWIVNEAQFNTIRDTHQAMITSQLPDAIYVNDAWDKFEHLGDGLHPTVKAVKKAVKALERHF